MLRATTTFRAAAIPPCTPSRQAERERLKSSTSSHKLIPSARSPAHTNSVCFVSGVAYDTKASRIAMELTARFGFLLLSRMFGKRTGHSPRPGAHLLGQYPFRGRDELLDCLGIGPGGLGAEPPQMRGLKLGCRLVVRGDVLLILPQTEISDGPG